MADTIRKQILDSLITHLKGEAWIVTGGVGINPGKTSYKKVEMPGMSVFVGPETGDVNTYGKQDCTAEVELKYLGLVINQMEIAFDVVEDIRGKIIKSAMTATLGGLSEKIEYAGGSIDYPTIDDGSFQVSALINIHYTTKKKDPYNQ